MPGHGYRIPGFVAAVSEPISAVVMAFVMGGKASVPQSGDKGVSRFRLRIRNGSTCARPCLHDGRPWRRRVRRHVLAGGTVVDGDWLKARRGIADGGDTLERRTDVTKRTDCADQTRVLPDDGCRGEIAISSRMCAVSSSFGRVIPQDDRAVVVIGTGRHDLGNDDAQEGLTSTETRCEFMTADRTHPEVLGVSLRHRMRI
jgi:hypothetical protein